MKRIVPETAAPLFIGGMEACWMIGILWLVESRVTPGELPVPWTMLGVPFAFVLGRLVQAISSPRRIAAVLTAGLAWILVLTRISEFAAPAESAGWTGLVSGLFQLRGGPTPLQITALAAAAAWAAGLRLSARPVDFEQILSEFQFGLLALLGVFFCAAQWGIALPALPPVVLIFFILFQLGMAAARSRDTGGWLESEARAPWLAALVFNVALVVGAGLLLTAIVSPGALALILRFLEAGWDIMTEWVIRFIAFLARLIPQPEIKSAAIGGGAGPSPQAPHSIPDLLSIPDYVRRIAAWLVSAFWVVLFAVCLWRVASQLAGWLRRRMNDMEGAEIEIVPGSFRQDLRRLLRWIRQRIAGWRAWVRFAIRRKSELQAMPAETAAVRRVYRALLAWSAARGCPRRQHQTPQEFLGRLCEWLPPACAELTLITEHYSAVRYGDERPGTDIIKTLERAWQDVRKMRNESRMLRRRNVFRHGRNL
jgi:hypothetical protein